MCAFVNYMTRRCIFFLILQISSSLSVTVNHQRSEPLAKKKVPLIPVQIPCFLNDIVRLSAPIVNQHDVYYLTRPSGDATKLNIHIPDHWSNNRTRYGRTIMTVIENTTVISDEDNYSVFKEKDFENKLKELAPNEFIVGPLLEQDYGNWVLSIYTKDINGDWIELFKVFTIAIIEFTILEPFRPIVAAGDTLNLSFAFPFPAIETCEIMAPRSTFDRYYNRNLTDFNKCRFTIPNITKEDEGTWTIIGFGKIVYQGDAKLTVILPTPLISEQIALNMSTKISDNFNYSKQ